MRCVLLSNNVENDEMLLVAATNSRPVVIRRAKTAPQSTKKATHSRRLFLHFGGHYTYEVDDVSTYYTGGVANLTSPP